MADDGDDRNLPVPVELTSEDVGVGENPYHDRRRGPYKFDALKRETYVSLIRQGYRRVRAAEMVGITYSTVIEAMRLDDDFYEAVSEAEMCKLDEVEEAMYETALSGNVTAQQTILFNRRPEQWTDTRTRRAREELQRQVEEEGRDEEDFELTPAEQLRRTLLDMRERMLEGAEQS